MMSIRENVIQRRKFAGPGKPVASGYELLGYAIVEQAVEDVKALKRQRAIINGRIRKKWPEEKYVTKGGKEVRKFLAIKAGTKHWSRVEVIRLLWFMNSGLDHLLESLDSNLDPDAIRGCRLFSATPDCGEWPMIHGIPA